MAMFWIRNNLEGTIRIQNALIGRSRLATLIPVSRFLIRKEKRIVRIILIIFLVFLVFQVFRFVLVRRTQRRPVFQEVGVVELGAAVDVEQTMRLCAYSHLVASPCRFVLKILLSTVDQCYVSLPRYGTAYISKLRQKI
jgi:hypothetical protein